MFTEIFFFSIWVFFHEHSQFIGQQGKGEALFNSSVTPPPPPASRTLDIGRSFSSRSSILHISGSWTRTGNLWFPSANRKPLSYAPWLLNTKLYIKNCKCFCCAMFIFMYQNLVRIIQLQKY